MRHGLSNRASPNIDTHDDAKRLATRFYDDPLEKVSEYRIGQHSPVRSAMPGDHLNFLTAEQTDELMEELCENPVIREFYGCGAKDEPAGSDHGIGLGQQRISQRPAGPGGAKWEVPRKACKTTDDGVDTIICFPGTQTALPVGSSVSQSSALGGVQGHLDDWPGQFALSARISLMSEHLAAGNGLQVAFAGAFTAFRPGLPAFDPGAPATSF